MKIGCLSLSGYWGPILLTSLLGKWGLACGSNHAPTRAVSAPIYRTMGSCLVELLLPHQLFRSLIVSSQLLEQIGKVRGSVLRARYCLEPAVRYIFFQSCQEQRDVGTSLLQCRCVQKIYLSDRLAVDCALVLHVNRAALLFYKRHSS